MNPSSSPVSESQPSESQPSEAQPLEAQPLEAQTLSPLTDSIATPLSEADEADELTPDPTFVKLAMRNMVSKGGKSLFHFALTTVGLLGLLVGLAFVTR
jgi:Protein of unknown function (DUF3285)